MSVEPRADVFTDGYFEFAIFRHDKGKEVDFTGYNGTSDTVVVPRYAVDPNGNRYRVTSIGRLPMLFPDTLRVLVLPNTMRSIVRINAPSLVSIVIPDSVYEISPAAFADCRSLRGVDLPPNLERIAPYTFDSCTSLVNVTIPNGVKTIAKYAFKGCTSLRDVAIPDGVRELGRFAFRHCSSLRWVVIGAGLKTIHEDMFEGCRSLESIVIGPGVRDIGENAFRNMANLTDVVLSEGLKRIGASAFEGCISLGSIVIPESVISIDSTSFKECSSLKGIFVRDGNVRYASSCGCLYDAKGSKLILCPPGMEGTFDVPDHVTSIEEGAFSHCHALTYVIIPDNVKSIGFNAFYDCSGLKSVSIGKGVRTLNSSVFEFCSSLSWVEMRNGIRTIGDHAFGSCSSLKRIDLPDSLQHINKYAFYGCTGLQTIRFGRNLSQIAPYAFLECGALVEFVVDEDNRNFVSINGALYTKDLKELVHYPSGRKEQYLVIFRGLTTIRTGAVLGPVSLRRYVVEDGNENFVSVDGVLFSKDLRELVRYPPGKGRSYSIPYGTLYISEDAFFGCSLRNMVIPDGVRVIGTYTFYGCDSLTSISLPGSLYSLMDHSFSKCTSLMRIYLRDRLESISIGHCAFAFCDEGLDILSDVEGYDLEYFDLRGKDEYFIPDGELPLFSGTLGLGWVPRD